MKALSVTLDAAARVKWEALRICLEAVGVGHAEGGPLHILIGALLGAAIGVIGAIVVAKVMHQPITWKGIAAGAVGGAVGGAITAATLGVGGAAAATAARAAAAYTIGGAGGGAADRVTDNLLSHKKVTDGVVESAVVGAVSGAAIYGLGRALSPLVSKVMARIPFRLRIPGRLPRAALPEGDVPGPKVDPRKALAAFAKAELEKGTEVANPQAALAARENQAHLLRMIDLLEQNRPKLVAAGVDPDTAINSILYSDLGKNASYLEAHANKLFPDLMAGDAKAQGLAKFKAFLLHEEPGIDLVRVKAAELGVSPEETDRIVQGIVGHNGPGTPGTFWGKNWDALIASDQPNPASDMIGKPYPLPEGPEAALHTALDRIDQGALTWTPEGWAGGPKKISADLLKGGMNLEAAIKESLVGNPDGTMLQLDQLRSLQPRTFELPFVQEGEARVLATKELFKSVTFTDGGKTAVIATPDGPVTATDFDGFWKGLSRVGPAGDGLPVPTVTSDTTALAPVTRTAGALGAAPIEAPPVSKGMVAALEGH
jgi:hypothetical protein